MSKKGIIETILPATRSIYGIRDDIGAEKGFVYMVELLWSSGQIGAGQPIEKITKILPTPQIVDFTQAINLPDSAGVQAGDIILKGISKDAFPDETLIDTQTDNQNLEKFYLIQTRDEVNKLYQVISIKEKYVSWQVQIRRLTTEDQVLRTIGLGT